MPPSTVD
jgi:hypothetical protein